MDMPSILPPICEQRLTTPVVLDQYICPLHCTPFLPHPRQVYISLAGNTPTQETDDTSEKEKIQLQM